MSDTDARGRERELANVFRDLYLEVVHLRKGLPPIEYLDQTARGAGYADAALEGRERAASIIRQAAKQTANDEAPEYGVERLPTPRSQPASTENTHDE